jgi:hypothetical protein
VSYADEVAALFNKGGASWVTPTDEDAWSKRRRIRAFFYSRFREAATDPTRVKTESRTPAQSRPDQRELPALYVFALDETVSSQSKDADVSELPLAIEILAEGQGECLLEVLDFSAFDAQPLPQCPCIGCVLEAYTLAVQGCFALWRDPVSSEAAKKLGIESTQQTAFSRTLEDRGDSRLGSARLTFTVTYTTSTGPSWPE